MQALESCDNPYGNWDVQYVNVGHAVLINWGKDALYLAWDEEEKWQIS